jgi:hypothetical protein
MGSMITGSSSSPQQWHVAREWTFGPCCEATNDNVAQLSPILQQAEGPNPGAWIRSPLLQRQFAKNVAVKRTRCYPEYGVNKEGKPRGIPHSTSGWEWKRDSRQRSVSTTIAQYLDANLCSNVEVRGVAIPSCRAKGQTLPGLTLWQASVPAPRYGFWRANT